MVFHKKWSWIETIRCKFILPLAVPEGWRWRYTLCMYRVKYRGSTGLTVLIIAAIIVLALLFFGPGSRAGSSSGTSNVSTSTQQASSTVSQALQFSSWLAKEYAPQKH